LATLLIIYGNEQGKRFTLEGDCLRLGRDVSNPIRLRDTEISRQHAELRRQDQEYLLTDLGSSNGTYLNGQRVREAKLKTGDRIQVGQTVLVFQAGTAASRDELAAKISMIAHAKGERTSSIVQSISQQEGSKYLTNPETAQGEWIRRALANLAVLYQASQAMSHIIDIDELLSRMLELAFQSIPADRGCVLIQHSGSGECEPRALHWREGVSRNEQIVISRTIVDYVLAHGEGVRSSDAAADERFASESIMKYGISEAVCAPMEGRHGMLGVIYLDNRVHGAELLEARPKRRFDDEHLKLLIAIGRQAALAVEETRYHQALVQSERLAAVGQTIATLSHHVKNILQGIKGGSHLIELGLRDDEKDLIRRGWDIVDKNQNKIYNLVMDMLSYSKEREPAFELGSLNEVVQEVVELMGPHANDVGVQLRVQLDATLPWIAFDPEGIHRALLNIVTNAIDATEEAQNGCVEVTTEYVPAQVLARVLVRDNGAGMAAEDLPNLFTLFTSTKGARGTGLGLPVSEKILREHGGQIQVSSKPGAGATFVLELPARQETPTMAM
jgi:signal transduction histidine kinase